MPYLGHRSSDFLELGISADAVDAPTVNPLETSVAQLVDRVARDEDDRHSLLEALGLVPTERTLAESA